MTDKHDLEVQRKLHRATLLAISKFPELAEKILQIRTNAGSIGVKNLSDANAATARATVNKPFDHDKFMKTQSRLLLFETQMELKALIKTEMHKEHGRQVEDEEITVQCEFFEFDKDLFDEEKELIAEKVTASGKTMLEVHEEDRALDKKQRLEKLQLQKAERIQSKEVEKVEAKEEIVKEELAQQEKAEAKEELSPEELKKQEHKRMQDEIYKMWDNNKGDVVEKQNEKLHEK